jgi:hypothetical protein
MKKLLALCLAALMLLGSASALAQEYTLDRKLQLQLVNGSGLTASATFTVTPGLKMSALDEMTNNLLTALLTGSKLDIRHIRGGEAARGQEDLALALTKGGTQVADVRFTTDGRLEALSSSQLGAQPLASLKGDGLIFSLFGAEKGSAWPGMGRLLFAINNADNAWRSRAETALKPYTDKMSYWLQGFTKITTGRDAAGKSTTENVIIIPAAQVKAQMKILLADLYKDTALLALLREQLTPREAAAYLEPAAQSGLQAAIDQLPLTKDVIINRRYDSTGAVVLDDIVLPMAGVRSLENIHYRYELAADGAGTTLIEAALKPAVAGSKQGAQYVLTLKGGPLSDAEEGAHTLSYTGALAVQPEAAGGFTVGADAAPKEKRYDLNLYYSAGKETLNETTRISTRPFEASLLIKPIGIEGLADQSIQMKGTLESALGDQAATRFAGQLTWQDMASESAITADVTGTSAPPWVIPTVASTNAIRLDSMTAQQLQLQRTHIQAALATAMARITSSLIPAQP